MPRTLPARPSLENLRRQARDLLRALHSGDTTARTLLAYYLPQTDPQQSLLAQALFVLAREYGFASWPQLKTHVETTVMSRRELARQRRQQVQLRREAEARRIALLAEAVLLAAKNEDLQALFAALVLSARDLNLVRAYLIERELFTLVIDALLLGVAHSQPRVRFLTAQAMDHWADERCAAPLRVMLHDPVPRVRWAAIHSLHCDECKLSPLTRKGDTTATLIALALHDPSIKVRRVATYELGQACANESALDALAQLAQTEDATIRREAQRALKRQSQP